MYTLPNFCRVCLKYDKNLIDLAHIENEPNETLMSKLQLCVSEVEWTSFKPLLCHPCIKRLNIAYSFKKQCVQSAGVLKNYVELVKESQKKNESQNSLKTDFPLPPGAAVMLLPNQKYVKILVGSQNSSTNTTTTSTPTNSFQNVFLNLIPSTTLTPVPSISEAPNKDTNQNVFLNLNNTFQKFIPVSSVDPPPLSRKENKKNVNVNVSQLLTESNAEEMSVEIDPTSFLSVEHDDPSSSEDESKVNDWDEVIKKTKIDPKGPEKINGDKQTNGKDSTGNYLPILPKEDFFSGGHFLSGTYDQGDVSCEYCQRPFPSMRLLKQHIKQFHLGKLPFKCTYCYTQHATRADYELCMKSHKVDPEASHRNSLTLKDFSANSSLEIDALSISLVSDTPADANLLPNENGEYVCTVCNRIFNSSSGLLRHKVRKHHQKNRKKYFIKGMKNAKCDICNREFSTQSYMQLHRKLHMRDDIGYKYKVLGKSKYKEVGDDNKQEEGDKLDPEKTSESIDVTPDISMLQDSDSSSENEMEPDTKKPKIDDGGTSDSQEVKDFRNSNQETNSTSSNDVNLSQDQNHRDKSEDEKESETSDESDEENESPKQ